MDALRRRFHIELEMALPHCALAMTGAGDDESSLHRLAQALLTLDREGEAAAVPVPGPPGALPPARLGLGQALRAPWEALPWKEAAGRVCAQYLWVYPPGIPLAVPGEELTAELLDRLEALVRGGAELRASPEGEPGTVRAAAE